MGRTELLRVNGISYKDIEKAGVLFVVVELHINYHTPAMYDEELQLRTIYSNVTASKIEHSYQLVRYTDRVLLADAVTILACINSEGNVRRIPKFMYPAS